MKNSLEMTAMDVQTIMSKAPQVFADAPKPGLSEKYTFLPTSRIIEDMDKLGWKVQGVQTNRSRKEVYQKYGTHVVKFYNPDVHIKDQNGNVEAYINIVILNNHTGLGSFKFEIGLFRLVCSNGLIIKDKDLGSFNLRHKGYSFQELRETMERVIEGLPDVVGRINRFNQVLMTAEQQTEFAQKAFALRSYQDRQMTEEELKEFLTPRRVEDEGNSLWTVFNRVQESVIRGGYHITNAKGKLRKAKTIKNVQKDLELNQQLWDLAVSYAA